MLDQESGITSEVPARKNETWRSQKNLKAAILAETPANNALPKLKA